MFTIPTREQIENLQVGDIALDPFGRMQEVVEITAKKEDINGKLFVHYYVKFGENSRISMSQKENKLTRTVELCNKYTSNEIRKLEFELTGENPI